jgi:outer membrane protein assembly factor BamA
VAVKGVRISPALAERSDADGQGPVSLDAPGGTLSPSVPLPGGAWSNKNEFVAAPIPFFSPSIGFGLGVGAAYLYNPPFAGTNSPPWTTGAGGFYSDNGSWGAGAAHKMNWKEDRWRLLGVAAYADLRYDFFGVGENAGDAGQSVPLRQTAVAGVVELLREIGHRWYVGGRYMVGTVRTSLDSDSTNLPPALAGFPIQLDARLSSFGGRLQRDTRDNSFYPTRGTLIDFDANFFDCALGSDFTFQTYALACNYYWARATNHVVALRGYGRAASGDVPFFALSSFGSHADLRGYTPGRYRDRLMFAVQGEYRWRIRERLGIVAFGGVGSVAPEIGQFDKLLPSVGAGARFVVARKNNISLRFDAAWGRDETVFYFGVGEAF